MEFWGSGGGGVKMLYLIGLGLDKEDISARALKAIKRCKEVFLEKYTCNFPYSDSELARALGKKAIAADRDFVENGTELLEKAKKKDIALLVYGDPLIATTHLALLHEARKKKVHTEVIHNVSVLNAITQTGLEAYKFGRVTSIPTWQENYQPSSFYDILKDNQKINAHTLFLLDIGLELEDAISYLVKVSTDRGEGAFTRKTMCIACSCLGTGKQKIKFATAERLARLKLQKPISLIVPARLHFVEEAYLKRFKF